MRKIKLCYVTSTILFLTLSNAPAQNNHLHTANEKASASINQAFDKLKTLVGKWKAKTEKGHAAYLYYEAVSNGTALHERFVDEGDKAHSNLITIYFKERDALTANHFCSMGNQPRLRTIAIADNLSEMTFSLVDITNLKTPDSPHMYKVTYKFQDPDHMVTIWTMRQGGKDVYVETLNWERQK